MSRASPRNDQKWPNPIHDIYPVPWEIMECLYRKCEPLKYPLSHTLTQTIEMTMLGNLKDSKG